MKHLRIRVEGKTYDVEVELLDEENAASPSRATTSARNSARVETPVVASTPAPQAAPVASGDGDLVSPLAAVVVSIDVAVGDTVEAGQTVVTLEAMKMNTVVTASRAGTIKAIRVNPGDAVEEGQTIASIA